MHIRQRTYIRAIGPWASALAAVFCAVTVAATAHADGLQTLYSFTGGADGHYPFDLTIAGSKLYGVTGGADDGTNGTVFSEFIGGGPVTTLYTFTGGNDGGFPSGGFALAGSTLYGTTTTGGSGGGGTIFSEFIGGGPVNTLYSFMEGNDGLSPHGSMALAGSTLYGTTDVGGAGGYGTIFSEPIGGGPVNTLYSFTGGADGGTPNGGMALAGSTLYGTTVNGGANSEGTVFSEFIGGGPVHTLHSFSGGSDGVFPSAGLAIAGSKLYGTTAGSSADGTVFSEFIGGGAPTTLHAFGLTNDGVTPEAAVTIAGSHIFGTTAGGGTNGDGTIFEMALDGSKYQVLHSFADGDGNSPQATLALVGSNLYGTTLGGGAHGYGTIFVLPITVQGDANLDGVVNGLDIALIASNWLQSGSAIPGDANGDGIVNGLDIALSASHWLQTFSATNAAVPEPATIVLAAFGVLALLAYGWRHL